MSRFNSTLIDCAVPYLGKLKEGWCPSSPWDNTDVIAASAPEEHMGEAFAISDAKGHTLVLQEPHLDLIVPGATLLVERLSRPLGGPDLSGYHMRLGTLKAGRKLLELDFGTDNQKECLELKHGLIFGRPLRPRPDETWILGIVVAHRTAEQDVSHLPALRKLFYDS